MAARPGDFRDLGRYRPDVAVRPKRDDPGAEPLLLRERGQPPPESRIADPPLLSTAATMEVTSSANGRG